MAEVLCVIAGVGAVGQAAHNAFVVSALVAGNSFFVASSHKAKDVVAIFTQGAFAKANVGCFDLATTQLGLVKTNGGCATSEISFGNEVDHAANGVSAVQGRRAIAQYFNTVNGRKGDHVEVGG